MTVSPTASRLGCARTQGRAPRQWAGWCLAGEVTGMTALLAPASIRLNGCCTQWVAALNGSGGGAVAILRAAVGDGDFMACSQCLCDDGPAHKLGAAEYQNAHC